MTDNKNNNLPEFEITLNAPLWYDFFDCVQQIISSEMTFRVTKRDGLELIEMDMANVGMVKAKLMPSAMKEFVVKRAGNFVVNTNALRGALKRKERKRFETVILSRGMKGEDSFVINLSSDKIDRTVRFGVNAELNPMSKAPTLKYECKATVPQKEFLVELTAMGDMVEGVALDTTSGKFCVLAVESGKILGSSQIFGVEFDGKAKCKYSIEYLLKMVKGLGRISDECLLEWKADYPLKLTAQIKGVKVQKILAPRVGDDEY